MHVTDSSGKGFPAPKFSPAFAAMTVNSNGMVDVKASCYLRTQSGAPASGVSTTPADDTPFGADCQTEMLEYDHNGFDVEDVHQIPGRTGPSLPAERVHLVFVSTSRFGV